MEALGPLGCDTAGLALFSIFTTAEMAGRMIFMTCDAKLVIIGKTQNLNWKALFYIINTEITLSVFSGNGESKNPSLILLLTPLFRKCELKRADFCHNWH